MRLVPVVRLICIAALADACGERAPAAPSRLAPPVSPTAPTAPTDLYTVSGTVYENGPDGVRPLPGAGVNAWVQHQSGGYSYWWGHGRLYADAAGRYQLRGLAAGVTVQLDVWTVPQTHVQQCAAPRLRVEADTNLDTHMVPITNVSASPASVPAPARGFRHVSGVIFEMARGEKRPVAGAFVDYEPFMDFPAAVTISDSEGRYLLCGLPDDETVSIGVGHSGRVAYVRVPPGQNTGADIVFQ